MAVSEWLAEEAHRSQLLALDAIRTELLALLPEETRAEAGALQGMTFVLTGTLPNLTREEARERIEAAGGKVTNSVSSKTDYLVVGDAPGGSKYNKAQSLNVPMIDERALRALIEPADEPPPAGQLSLPL